MPATMRDVAALAGVSLKTVSRVVNLEPHTRPEVVRRVQAAIEELEWAPNRSAQALRTGRTNVIAVAISHLVHPYHARLAEGVVTELSRRGLEVALEPTRDSSERLRVVAESVGHDVDGLVLLGRSDPGFVASMAAQPVVLVQGGPTAQVDSVDIDLTEAASLVMRHLAMMGRRRPALVGFERFHAGVETFRVAGVAQDLEPVVLKGDYASREDGVSAARRALAIADRPDAIVCASDEVATGVLHALASEGCSVPDDIAVTGFDNIDDGLFSTPSITTIDPGVDELSRMAVDLLMARLSGVGSGEPRHVECPVSLVRRESTLGLGVA